MGWIYQIVLWLALPFVWLRLQLRARREPEYGLRQNERLGHVPDHVRSHCVWFHTVSAGETIAATPLIKQIAQEYSDLPVLVTTMTPTGSQQVVERLGDSVDHCYAPYDFAFAVERFFSRVKPRMLVLMETELWPNLIGAADAAGIPVILINARLSARSAKGYAKVGGLTRRMLSQLSDVACQSEEHRQRFIQLGANPERTQVTGSVKFDLALPDDFTQKVQATRLSLSLTDQPVWIAASTHPGEDELVLAAFAQVRQHFPQVCLILVPRHPVRADDVGELVCAAGFSFAKQSQCTPQQPAGDVDVVIGDVMGTLLTLYGVADIAFVGGSLVPLGGHNPLEPALCKLPIVCGPHQFNFPQISEVLAAQGGLNIVQTAEELSERISAWLGDRASAKQVGEAAASVVDANRGATAKVLVLLRERIDGLT